jgi:TAT (twin-arginine translocation) pathway-exported protein
MDRRDFLKTSAAASAGLALQGILGREVSASRSSLLTANCLWGAFANPLAGQTDAQAYLALEKKIGRKFALTRQYLSWDADLPGAVARWSASHGRIPYISFKALHSNGGAVRWASIASGSKDSFIRAQAERMRAWGHRAYMSFHHEPEDDPTCGSPSEFRAAYAHIRRIFEAHRVNVRWVVALMASTYDGGNGGYRQWFPPAYEFIGVDGYNRYPCIDNRTHHPWQSFHALFGSAYAAAGAENKPMFVAEAGCVEQDACGYGSGDPLAKARWFTGMGETLRAWPRVEAVMYSNTTLMHRGYRMNYRVDSSTASLAAYRKVGLQAYFM